MCYEVFNRRFYVLPTPKKRMCLLCIPPYKLSGGRFRKTGASVSSVNFT